MNLKNNTKGNLLIWTVMLGMMLVSVFFFFGTRLRNSSLVQRETLLEQSKRGYLSSYREYLKNLDLSEPISVNLSDEDETYNITGTVSRETNTIEDFLDTSESRTYAIAEEVSIEWNQCDWRQEGDLLINGEILQRHTPICDDQTYDESILFTPADDTLTLTAVSGPFHFRLRTYSGARMTDTRWHLNLSIPLLFRKTLQIQETFTP